MPTMKFIMEEEIENKINFLDITIPKQKDKLSFDVYMKRATRDTIIPNDSCHPQEHKLGAVRFLTNRVENTTELS